MGGNFFWTVALSLCIAISNAQTTDIITFKDTYVRGGTYGNDNFGSDNQLSVKNSQNSDFDRLILVAFDLTGLNVHFISANLKMTTKGAGPDFSNVPLSIAYLNNANWSENSISWNAMPSSSDNQIVSASAGLNNWEVTGFVNQALSNDSILTFILEIKENGISEDAWAHFYSREDGSTSNRPTLEINGETISNLLPANNQINWGIAGVEGGIPTYANEINVLGNGVVADGVTDNALALQSIINNAPTNSVVYFPPGDYFFASTIYLKNNIIIRGACVSNTVLNFDLAGTAAPSFWFKSTNSSNPSTITAGYEKDSEQITVADASAFQVGDFVEITQDNDPTLMYTRPDWDVSWAQDVVGQMVEITAINGNSINLKHPLMYTFSQSLNVKASPTKMITGAGLENLKVHRVDNGNDYNLRFDFAYNCWIRNIEGSYCDRGHIAINQSAHIEIRESYFHHAYDYGGGGHGYGVNLQDHTTAALIENNIFHFLRHTYLAKEGSIGNVFAYNYSREPNGSNNDIALHGHFGLMNLIEGNIVQKIIAGDYWGPSGPGNTYFRNRVETDDIIMQDATHAQNIIGNEIVNGDITITDSHDTWRLSNKASSGFIDTEFGSTMTPSLVHNNQPDFMTGYNWPAIGPEFTLGQHTIPAKARWDDNNMGLVPCLNVGTITNLEEKNAVLFNIYPNPSNGIITISASDNTPYTLKIMDQMGQVVRTEVLTGQQRINLSAFSKGVYLIGIQTTNSNYTQSIVIK